MNFSRYNPSSRNARKPVPMIPRSEDIIVLEMLHMRDAEGMTAKQIGAKFGKTKNSVIGLFSRISKHEESGQNFVRKKENKDGAMGARWWFQPGDKA